MKELRHYSGSQIRIAPDSDGKKLIGLAIPYNSLSRNLGGFVERFVPGAVADSLTRGDIVALLNHDLSQTLGTQGGKTLRLFDQSDGLHVEIDVPDTSYARDAVELLKRGDGTGMSFGFNPTDVEWTKENGTNVAEVRKAELGEVSVLTGPPPAYGATSIALRAFTDDAKIAADSYGLDLDALAGAFLAIKRGLPLSEVETEVVAQARGLFATIRHPRLEQAKSMLRSVTR